MSEVTEIDARFAGRLEYVAVDRSPAMRAAAAGTPGIETLSPEQVPERIGDHVGGAVAVALFDALPVHRVRRRHVLPADRNG